MLPDFALKAPQAEKQLVLIFEAKPAASPFLRNLLALAFVGVIHLEASFVLGVGGTGRELVISGPSGKHSCIHWC